MNRCNRTLLSLLLTSITLIPARPISETTAVVGAGVGGTLAGAAVGVGAYVALKDQDNQAVRIGASGLAALGASGISGYVLYRLLHTMTPPGRVAAASIMINNAACDSLVCNEFMTNQALFSHATARFGTSWPLVLARERYTTIRQNLETSRDLINLAYQEAQRSPSYSYLCSQCSELIQAINRVENIIEQRFSAIIKNEKYDLQIQLYEKHLEAERKRAQEQLLQANKLIHDSMERNKDRLQDSKERSKDRGEKTEKIDEHKNIDYALQELETRKNSHGFSRMWRGIITSQISELRNKNSSMADVYQERYNNIIKGGGFLEDLGAVEEIVRAKNRQVENALYDLDRVVKGSGKNVFEEWQKQALHEINCLTNEQDRVYYKKVYDLIMIRRPFADDPKERSKDRREKTDEQKNIDYALQELETRKNSHGFSRMWRGIITSQISEFRNKNSSMADVYQERYNNIIKGGGFLEDLGAVEEIVRAKNRQVENVLYDLDRVVKGAPKDVFGEWQKQALKEINLFTNEQDRAYYKKAYDIIMVRRTL